MILASDDSSLGLFQCAPELCVLDGAWSCASWMAPEHVLPVKMFVALLSSASKNDRPNCLRQFSAEANLQ